MLLAAGHGIMDESTGLVGEGDGVVVEFAGEDHGWLWCCHAVMIGWVGVKAM